MMIKYYFVSDSGTIFINLPLSVSRETLSMIASDVQASSVYYVVCGNVKVFLDF